jgi:hypothetical protein
MLIGDEFFVCTVGVFSNHIVRGVKNWLSRPVILLELDDRCAGVITFEVQYICKISTTPTIDRLPIVANHTKVLLVVNQ